jgi:hypothetical protein
MANGLAGWANFYVIVGSSAAALIGVQFVVVALIANLRRKAAPQAALFAVGAATLALLLVGVHNAWDTVTYVVIGPGDPGAPAVPAPPGRVGSPPDGA